MSKKNSAKGKEEVKETKPFTMTTKDGKETKDFKVVAPMDSLDEDGNAESALKGIYRHA